jgi:hypothetical protein
MTWTRFSDASINRCPADFEYISQSPTANRGRPAIIHALGAWTFTSSIFLDSLRWNGLLPDTNKERTGEDGVPSDSESVYLCSSFDRFYLRRAVERFRGSGIMVVSRFWRNAS